MRHVIKGVVVFGLVYLNFLSAGAFHKDGADSPTTEDRRYRRAQPAVHTLAASKRAEAELKTRVPTVRVDFDSLLHAPQMIQAADGFLSGPNGSGRTLSLDATSNYGPPESYGAAKVFLREHRDLFGHGDEVLSTARIKRDYLTAHNKVRTVVWEQYLDDIRVFESVLIATTTASDELVNLSSRFVPSPEFAAAPPAVRRATLDKPQITPVEAMVRALRDLGETVDPKDIRGPVGDSQGAAKLQHFEIPACNGMPRACLVWLPIQRSELRLCWEVSVTTRRGGSSFLLLVDADSGQVWIRRRLTKDLEETSYRVFTSDSPSPFSPGHNVPATGQPALTDRTLVTWAALSTNASPAGWLDGSEFETRGNNVDAHSDRDGDDSADLPYPRASAARVFDFPMDLRQPPSTYTSASVVQLFYWCNWMHDRLHDLGFDEAAGNFQNNNFGRGGLGNDALQADAQDGAAFNNANFTPSDDGVPPRIQMFLFNGPTPDRDGALDAEIILHEYTHGLSTRLVGGGVGISALQSDGLGEGWSDFYSLALLSESADNLNGAYAAGGYVTASLFNLDQNYYFGVRRYPYSTDMAKNPLTFKDIDPSQVSSHSPVPLSPLDVPFSPETADEVHNQGEVWCVTLWDARANLIRKYGFEAGNRLILQLVTDGMKLSPPNPNFLQARDAILMADRVNNRAENQKELWEAFSKRGMGFSARSPDSITTSGVVEAFDPPDDLILSRSVQVSFRGPVGGPFVPSEALFELSNVGSAAIDWTAQTSSGWLTVSPTSGKLDPGPQRSSVRASLNLVSDTLPIGVHRAEVEFVNVQSGVRQLLPVRLFVGQPDYLVESLDGASRTLSHQMFTFTPDGSGSFYSVCREPSSELPSPRSGGNSLTLGDDDWAEVSLGGDAEVHLFGRSYRKLYVSSNGSVTFDFGDGSARPDLEVFFIQPRVAGLAMDLDPSSGGRVSWQQFSNRVAVTFASVNEFAAEHLNTFQLELFFDGAIRLTYEDIESSQAIVGLSRGGGVPEDFEESAFNRFPGCQPKPTLTVTGNLTEGDGLLKMRGAVQLPQPATSDLEVKIVSSDTSELIVPSMVTISAGQDTALFDIEVVDDEILDGTQSVTVKLFVTGLGDGESRVFVSDNESARLQLSLPATVREGGLSVMGKLTVDPVPEDNVLVTLSSSDSAELIVPGAVVIPGGKSEIEFAVSASDEQDIDGTELVEVRARVSNWTDGAATIQVEDNELRLIGIELPASLPEDEGVVPGRARVYLSGFLATNLVVQLAASDPARLSVPATVTLLAGESNVLFSLTPVNDARVNQVQTVELVASSEGFETGRGLMVISDDESPSVPSRPFPHDTATNVSPDLQLSWKGGGVELISNGGFETGNLDGWSVENTGPGGFSINDGALDPTGPANPTLPFEGSFSAVSQQSSPGRHILFQELNLPSRGEKITLSWVHRIENYWNDFSSGQRFSVLLLDPKRTTNTLVATLFSTREGDVLLQDWEAHQVDLTSYQGQTVRLAFIEEDDSFYLTAHLDNVSVVVERSEQVSYDVYFGTHPDLGPLDLLGTTTNKTWNLPLLAPASSFFWRVTANNIGQTVGPTWQFSTRGASQYEWGLIASPQLPGQPFTARLRATDSFGQWVTNVSGSVRLTAEDTSPTGNLRQLSVLPTNRIDLVDGLWSGQLSIGSPGLRVSLQAQDESGRKGRSVPFEVVATNDVYLQTSAELGSVLIGQILSVTIAVTNTGPGVASGVTVAHLLTGLLDDPVTVEMTQGTFTRSGSQILCQFGDLPGASSRLVTLRIHPSRLGTFSVLSTAGAQTGDTDPSNNSVARSFEVVGPRLSIEDGSGIEGDTQNTEVRFNVSLSTAVDATVGFSYRTVGGSAGANIDFVPTSGRFTFSPGETNGFVLVTILGDGSWESTERFSLEISNTENATLASGVRRSGVIVDNDPPSCATLPFREGWESGQLAAYWLSSGELDYTTEIVENVESHGGLHEMTMRSSLLASRNELTLCVNAAHHTNLVLRFWARGTDETPDGPPPAPIQENWDFDGVAVSDDGRDWYEARSLRGLGQTDEEIVVNLDETMRAHGLSYGPYLFVRFNRYSSDPFLSPASITIDDIELTGQRAGLQAESLQLAAESCIPANGVVDPGEMVTVLLPLRADGSLKPGPVIANLIQSGGVLAPSGPQEYGILQEGDEAVSRSFTFVADGPCGGKVNLSFRIIQGEEDLGVFELSLPLGSQTNSVASFQSPTPIVIPSFGDATPFGSPVFVDGVQGSISGLRVSISNLTHSSIADLDVLLVGPQGQMVLLMSDVGGIVQVRETSFTFVDEGPSMPAGIAPAGGRYRPTNYDAGEGIDVFGAPVPIGSYSTRLAAFTGTKPNGEWRLFVQDDAGSDEGIIAGGWGLTMETSVDDCCQNPGTADLALSLTKDRSRVLVGDSLTLTMVVENRGPAGSQQVQSTLVLPVGLELLSVETPHGEWTTNDSVVAWAVGNLRAGEVAVLTLRTRVTSSGTLTAQASVHAASPDSDSSNNEAKVSIVSALPVVTILDQSVFEGDTAVLNATFVATLSPPSGRLVSFAYATEDGSALSGVDYLQSSGVISFLPGQTSRSFTVGVRGDRIYEGNESFSVRFSNATNATLSRDSAVGVVYDNEEFPVASVAGSTIREGDNGFTNLSFRVTLSAANVVPVDVTYRTRSGSALPGFDYVDSHGTLTIPAGSTSQNVLVPVYGDTAYEPSENLFLELLEATGAFVSFTANQAVGTILNDDLRALQFAALPFHEDWESGIFGPHWAVSGVGAFDAHIGRSKAGLEEGNVLIMESAFGLARHEVTLGLDVSAWRNVVMRFQVSRFDVEGNAPPSSPFNTGANFDGVALSTNGVNWYEFQPLRDPEPLVEQYTIALSETLDRLRLGHSANLRIRFNHYGDYGFEEWMSIGDISISGQPRRLVLTLAELVAEGCPPPNGVVDPEEVVTYQLYLRNEGSEPSTNIVVSLLSTNGIVSLSEPQLYGLLPARGEPVARPFTLAAHGACGEVLQGVLQVQEGGEILGFVPLRIELGVGTRKTNSFVSTQRITIPEFGESTPFPSIQTVRGLTGVVERVTVTLSGFSHTFPIDVNVLLISPGGGSVVLMSGVGSGETVSSSTLTFDDAASRFLPIDSLPGSGTFLPTRLNEVVDFPSTVPAGPYGKSMRDLLVGDPNGDWSLFVYDHSFGDSGSLRGWTLRLFTADYRCCDVPQIFARWDNGMLLLEWPSSAAGYFLESASAVSDQMDWLPTLETASEVAGWFQVRMPLTSAKRFFRLKN